MTVVLESDRHHTAAPLEDRFLRRRLFSLASLREPADRIARRLEPIPAEALDQVLDGLVDSRTAGRDGAALLKLTAHDPRVHVRIRTAETVSELAGTDPHGLEDVLELLVRDPIPVVREAAIVALTVLLRKVGGLRRARILCDWTVSSRATKRAAIAEAIPRAAPTVGAPTAMEMLAHDDAAAVRRAAATGARRLLDNGWDWYLRILDRLVLDNRRSVRLAAIEAAGDAISRGLGRRVLPPLAQAAALPDEPTAEKAADVLSFASTQQPDAALDALRDVVDQADEVSPRVLHRLVTPLARLGVWKPAPVRRLLARLRQRDEPWLSRSAREALEILEERGRRGRKGREAPVADHDEPASA